ncbi:AlbA family DNA-binding domain-containing protein [Microbacterium wangchenii]|uniref:AlbA family DNA-binding domain-containing protein n=1 Tax=Microbacterium wangchenii TaxID=2541726 RepID=UPI0011CCCDDE|nr:hypothetical protein [Microbacterium wangchenii]TXK11134.1 hypothetical protein FVP99_17780 [Microbacterium wangchenii]
MALSIDSSRARRSYTALRELVLAIRDSGDPGAEHHAIEWKSELDLSTKEGQFAVARAIIGLANRTVANAARHFEGLGYVAVGVTVGAAAGTKQWDGADLEPVLAAYLGPDGPVWHHDNIDVDGASVLVFTVESPRRGDRIHTLRKSFSSSTGKAAGQDGDAYVRRNARTERANSAEIRALEERLLSESGQPRLDLDVAASGEKEPVVVALDLSESAVAAMVDHERSETIASGKPGGKELGSIAMASLERPSPEALEDYLGEWQHHAPDLFRAAVLRWPDAPKARISVHNPGEEAIESMKVTVVFPARVEPHLEPVDPVIPERPKSALGGLSTLPQHGLRPFMQTLRKSQLPGSPLIQQRPDGRWEVRFSPRSLHAHQTTVLEDVTLLLPTTDGDQVEAALVAEVRITASNRSGLVRNELQLFPTRAIPPWAAGLSPKPIEDAAEPE